MPTWGRSVSLVSSVPFYPLVRSKYNGWHDLGHIVALHEHATLDLRSDARCTRVSASMMCR